MRTYVLGVAQHVTSDSGQRHDLVTGLKIENPRTHLGLCFVRLCDCKKEGGQFITTKKEVDWFL